jgi:outer membrane protein assembly factor BamB
VDPTPAKGKAWSLPSADPINPTPSVLVALEDDIVIAGSTSDPALAGLDAFDPGTTAESFVARLDHEGNVLWSTPLHDSGLPSGIAIDPAGDIVVIGPYLPVGLLWGGSDTTYWAKLRPTGELVVERELDFYASPVTLAVDQDGQSYLGGWERDPNETLAAFLVFARYDERGDEVWKQRFHHVETSSQVMSLAIDSNGYLVLTGYFNGAMDLGGGELRTQRLGWITNGFFARFTADGEHISSEKFGGSELDVGWFIRALPDGDVLLGGTLTGSADLLGESIAANPEFGSAFLTRLDGLARPRWTQLPELGMATAVAVDPDGERIHFAGHENDQGVAWLAECASDGTEASHTLLARGDIFFNTRALAVDSRRSLWLSGGFYNEADFGNDNVLFGDPAGVFLIRLDRQ